MIKKYLQKNWLLILILLIASFLRLYRIDAYMEFLGDQGRDVTIIKKLFTERDLFFIGPQTSIGNMYLGPYFYYLIAPALFLSNYNPVGPAIFIAILNILTVYLIYLISRNWFNKKVAYTASFLYAISPVVIKYSNFIWNPNIMPLFSLLFVYFFFEAFRSKKYNLFLYSSLAFIMVINSHYLGLALLPFIGIFWFYSFVKFIKLKSVDLKPFVANTLLAVLIFIISLTPQILFDIKHDGQISKSLIIFFTQRETTVSIKPYKAIPELPALFTQINTRLLGGKHESAGIIISLVFISFIIFYLISPNKKAKNFWILLFWYLSGLISLGLYKQHIYDHYFAFLFPSVFILIAYLITKYKLVGIPILIIITFFSLMEIPLRWRPNNQLQTVNLIAETIINNSNDQNFNFALLAKQNYDPPYRYILTNKQAKIVDLPLNLADQLFVVCEPFQMECNPINNPEWAIAAFGWAKIQQEWNINGIKVFKLIPNQDGQKK